MTEQAAVCLSAAAPLPQLVALLRKALCTRAGAHPRRSKRRRWPAQPRQEQALLWQRLSLLRPCNVRPQRFHTTCVLEGCRVLVYRLVCCLRLWMPRMTCMHVGKADLT